VIVGQNDGDEAADALEVLATGSFAFNKSTLRIAASQAVAQNLPPALAASIPQLPLLKSGKAFAVLCSGSTCQPPTADAEELRRALDAALQHAR